MACGLRASSSNEFACGDHGFDHVGLVVGERTDRLVGVDVQIGHDGRKLTGSPIQYGEGAGALIIDDGRSFALESNCRQRTLI
ncbi:hypothetical protein ASD42_27315 [Nocardia sp. Root136]|uniref:hypothetical protein n=1 Tax=Nocardia sp. Root136 TaxID=1736458 RepID=UPI0006F8D9D0|nr:hypothetical protein [Nocardia sp. Root136]KQY29184.1 hypothetical protein ASD42_27315 [Nocardia sp. Root136]